MIGATINFTRAYAEVRTVVGNEFQFFTNSLSIGEVAVVVLTKAETDGYTITDVSLVHANKGLAHAISFADDLVKSVIYQRQITDGFTLDDISKVDKDVDAVQGNIATMLDVHGFAFSTPLNDTMASFSEVVNSHLNKAESDSFSFTDSLERVVVWSRGLGHSVNLTEATALTYNKVLTDGFVLDSATLVNKNFDSTKGNVFTFSDQVAISRTHGRALGNMMLGTLKLN